MRLKARNRIVTGALLLLVLLVVFGALLSGAPPARAAEAFTLEGRAAPLGMATDHARDRYWVLERASGRLQITAIGADGMVQGRMSSRDTVSSAQGLAFWDGEAWVGDIGGRREQVVVLRITEPWPGTEIRNAVPYALTYPDGRHDAAALLVDGDHRLHVVTRGEGAGVYRAPADPSSSGPNALERVADAPSAEITDGVVLQDGRWVLRDATTLYTLDPASLAVVDESAIGVEERGRSVTESLTLGSVLTALGPAGEVTSTAVSGPTPSASPTARPVRTVAPPAEAGTPDPTRTFEQTGTTTAMTAALVLAGLAAVVVLFRR